MHVFLLHSICMFLLSYHGWFQFYIDCNTINICIKTVRNPKEKWHMKRIYPFYYYIKQLRSVVLVWPISSYSFSNISPLFSAPVCPKTWFSIINLVPFFHLCHWKLNKIHRDKKVASAFSQSLHSFYNWFFVKSISFHSPFPL